ncbi:Branched-chain amino acid ABC transporter, ATP-binding protein [Pseudomonas amygdali pv. tabaci]|uniref:Branched-chain amino acid ABC transporter, ATP-binding protein n=1 Tax=Pseudomonas amygdali pv. tabaci TaxID=322 RepID=A0A3M6FLN4_PSEAJ|nr:Branched-chain amino acid ABC transporter, ATP-binding protein [Pseudomonas amygdali pv. tabaci]
MRLRSARLQAVCLGLERRAVRPGRGPVCAAGRHHQPQRNVPDQLYRSSSVGSIGRPWHVDRPIAGRGSGERHEKLVHRGFPGILAVLSRRAVHHRHAVPAQRRDRLAEEKERAMKTTPTPSFMLEPVLAPNSDAGTSRDAVGLGKSAGKGLNTRHGTILTLEDISVSFDGFKALNDLNLYIGVGELRCIIGPNGRWQDHADGRHHRQDPPQPRQGLVRRNAGPDADERSADCSGRNWPKVPETDGVRSLERVREP